MTDPRISSEPLCPDCLMPLNELHDPCYETPEGEALDAAIAQAQYDLERFMEEWTRVCEDETKLTTDQLKPWPGHGEHHQGETMDDYYNDPLTPAETLIILGAIVVSAALFLLAVGAVLSRLIEAGSKVQE